MEIKTILFSILVALSIFELGLILGRKMSKLDDFMAGRMSQLTEIMAMMARINNLKFEKRDEERETK